MQGIQEKAYNIMIKGEIKSSSSHLLNIDVVSANMSHCSDVKAHIKMTISHVGLDCTEPETFWLRENNNKYATKVQVSAV